MSTAANSARPRVSVIILNWNGRDYLAACLPSLLRQTYPNFEVVVVDNGSTDGSGAFVEQQFPQARLIGNDRNLGFAAANNQAIRATQGEFVALLNNDTVADPRWLEALLAAAADPAVGMVATQMRLAHRPDRIDSAGVAIDRAGIAWGVDGGAPVAAAPPTAVTETFGASGGAALYRRAMLDDNGLFDEAFFAYLEDVDLAWRAQWAGWRALYAPGAVVTHHHSATGNRIPHFKSRLLGRNKLWLLAKNYPFPALLWYLPIIALYEGMSLAVAWRERRLRSALAGRWEALRRLPMMLARRRRLVKRISAQQMMARLHPVEAPWRVLRRYGHTPPAGPAAGHQAEAPTTVNKGVNKGLT